MLKQKDWIDVLVEKLGCSKKDAKDYYDMVFNNVKANISEEESIKISGFGVFKLRKTMAKEQVNLVTQQVEVVPEHFVITFKPYFEIQPKPEAIEIEDENIEAAFDAAAAVSAAAEVALAEERAKEVAEKEEVKEQPENETEPTFVEKEKEVEKEKIDVSEPSELHWIYEGQEHTEKEIKLVLLQKTGLPEIDIVSSLSIIKKYIKKTAPETTKVEIKEFKDTFNFVFQK